MAYFIDPFHFCVALLPLAVYLVAIGMVNLATRPRVVSGSLDLYSLGFGLTGLMLIGPLRLFLPTATVFRLGAWVWPLLLVAYLLFLTLTVLLSRPRLVIYNLGPETVRALLQEIFAALDSESRWAGDAVSLPNLGVELYIESVGTLRNVQLIATRVSQNLDGWAVLQTRLQQRLRQLPPERNRYGLTLIFSGLLLVASCATWVVADSQLVARSFQEALHPNE